MFGRSSDRYEWSVRSVIRVTLACITVTNELELRWLRMNVSSHEDDYQEGFRKTVLGLV